MEAIPGTPALRRLGSELSASLRSLQPRSDVVSSSRIPVAGPIGWFMEVMSLSTLVLRGFGSSDLWGVPLFVGCVDQGKWESGNVECGVVAG